MALYEGSEPRRKLSGQLTFFLVWLGITGVAAVLHPDPTGHGTHEQLGLPPCPSVLLFDRPCPGCGLTTSWTALIHGDIGFAFHAHPFGPVLYLFFTATAWLALRGWLRNERFQADGPRFNRVMMVAAIVFFSFGITRMALTK